MPLAATRRPTPLVPGLHRGFVWRFKRNIIIPTLTEADGRALQDSSLEVGSPVAGLEREDLVQRWILLTGNRGENEAPNIAPSLLSFILRRLSAPHQQLSFTWKGGSFDVQGSLLQQLQSALLELQLKWTFGDSRGTQVRKADLLEP